jgi:hypothetical protein
LADYRDRTDAFLRAGYRVAALSVDEPQRTEHLRRALSVSFPIWCDVERQVVRDWDLFNPREKGGIAVPATFVLDGERRVRLSSIEDVRHRADADEVLACVRTQATQVAKRTLRPAMLRVRNPQLALKDVDFGSFLLLVLWRIAFLAHGLSAHLDAMSVVHQTVEDAVSDGGIADLLVPARDWQLGSKDGGPVSFR